MKHVIPVSAVVPTRDRLQPLTRMLEGLRHQSALPAEVIVVDASDDTESKGIVAGHSASVPIGCTAFWMKAKHIGAAVQRNEGVAAASQPFILFCDDDILFEPDCIIKLWSAIVADEELGGVSSTIVNQQYHQPGFASRIMFRLISGNALNSFAGRVIGPAVNLLPEDMDYLPEVVSVDWMNLGCTIYRREALPTPPFQSEFTGYSLMEDLALSLEVGKRWKLANARTARIFHDSQPGEHKSDVAARSAMELVNRHYVMTKVLEKRRFSDYLRLAGWELFQLAALSSSSSGRKQLLSHIAGRLRAVRKIVSG